MLIFSQLFVWILHAVRRRHAGVCSRYAHLEGELPNHNATSGEVQALQCNKEINEELNPFNEDIRRALGAKPDKLAQNMYAISATQGSNVFRLVKDLEDLSDAYEKTIEDMAKFAKRVEEERKSKQIRRKKE